jgi:ATP-dependent DNA ligase
MRPRRIREYLLWFDSDRQTCVRCSSKMEQYNWVKSKLVCQVALVEWTDAWHLRHCTFVAMRYDRKPAEVVRET